MIHDQSTTDSDPVLSSRYELMCPNKYLFWFVYLMWFCYEFRYLNKYFFWVHVPGLIQVYVPQ
jgi:hypothetical protein